MAQKSKQNGLYAPKRLLVDILETRGVVLQSATRARIEQCDDVAVLTRWCTKASGLTGAADELFDEPRSITPLDRG